MHKVGFDIAAIPYDNSKTALGTVLALIILALLPQVRPSPGPEEMRRQDTGAPRQPGVRARDTQEESPGEW